MRISDWSSDVCSSDLLAYVGPFGLDLRHLQFLRDAPPLLDLLRQGVVQLGQGRRPLAHPALQPLVRGLEDLFRPAPFRDVLDQGEEADRKSTRLNSSH